MNGEHLKDRISLYLYGEMSEVDAARFEVEIDGSPELAEAVESERRFLRQLHDRAAVEAPEALLAECRHDLMRAVYREHRPNPNGGLLAWLQDTFQGIGQARIAWQPTVALLLIGLGFLGGRATQSFWETATSGGASSRGGSAVSQPVNASLVSLGNDLTDVHSINMDPQGGQVSIVVEQRRTISGDPSDPAIQNLLLSMARSSNSGVRLESLDVLRRSSDDSKIRSTLITSMLSDANPGVRLKALEALSPYMDDPRVRAALTEVLRQDENAGMRVQAIELLTQHPDHELVGVLQDVVRDEQNNYVRLQCERTLEALNASAEVY